MCSFRGNFVGLACLIGAGLALTGCGDSPKPSGTAYVPVTCPAGIEAGTMLKDPALPRPPAGEQVASPVCYVAEAAPASPPGSDYQPNAYTPYPTSDLPGFGGLHIR